MAEFSIHRGWMYDRCYPGRRGFKEDFLIRVEDFVRTARQYKYYALDGGIRCPCLKCQCTKILKDQVVEVHLYQKGFMPNYKIWTFHGEEMPSVDLTAQENCLHSSSTGAHTSETDQFMYMQEMVNDALNRHASFEQQDNSHLEESPNEATQRVYNLLAEANQPIFKDN